MEVTYITKLNAGLHCKKFPVNFTVKVLAAGLSTFYSKITVIFIMGLRKFTELHIHFTVKLQSFYNGIL